MDDFWVHVPVGKRRDVPGSGSLLDEHGIDSPIEPPIERKKRFSA
jgi:hypothetical protein